MFSYSSPLRKSPGLRRYLALALADAENQIVEANVEEAVAFLKATERELPFEGALAIYFRLVDVPKGIRHAVTIHTLSRLAEEPGIDEILEDAPGGAPGGVRALARRMQGRRFEELRRTVEETTSRARTRVRSSLLAGANQAVESLREIVPPSEALKYFIESLQVGQGWAEILTHEISRLEWVDHPTIIEEEDDDAG